jgi:hypothetical protein
MAAAYALAAIGAPIGAGDDMWSSSKLVSTESYEAGRSRAMSYDYARVRDAGTATRPL